MSDNWIVQNLQTALDAWNKKLTELWSLLSTSPQDFKGGRIWQTVTAINGAVHSIGLALLVLFFVMGLVWTCGSASAALPRACRRSACILSAARTSPGSW